MSYNLKLGNKFKLNITMSWIVYSYHLCLEASVIDKALPSLRPFWGRRLNNSAAATARLQLQS